MRHAKPEDLDGLEPLLVRVRELDGLVERSRGVFYRRSRAFLHFHHDPTGMHADVRLGAAFERFRVEERFEQDELVEAIRRAIEGA